MLESEAMGKGRAGRYPKDREQVNLVILYKVEYRESSTQ